jgi:aldehyde dehydrogenase (NAD+)
MSTTLPLSFLEEGRKGLLIGGEWVSAVSGKTFPTVDPSTGKVIAELAEGGAEDADRAVAAARAAVEGPWRGVTPAERQSIVWAVADAVEAHVEELRHLEAIDMGLPIGPAPGAGADKAVEVLRYFAGWATKVQGDTLPNSMPWSIFTYTLKEPVGVVASIIPWNSPINNVLWKLAPVLASGCTMVLKPAEEASLVALRIGELLTEAGVPDGVVNIVTGFGETVGARLAEHPDVDKVAFTGSSERPVIRLLPGRACQTGAGPGRGAAPVGSAVEVRRVEAGEEAVHRALAGEGDGPVTVELRVVAAFEGEQEGDAHDGAGRDVG